MIKKTANGLEWTRDGRSCLCFYGIGPAPLRPGVRKVTKALEILDVFEIEGKGTVIIGVPEIEESRIPRGCDICLRRSGQDDASFEVLDRELMRNDWSPHKPRSLALLISREYLASSIPRGSEVWKGSNQNGT